jgi:hypothetical protein
MTRRSLEAMRHAADGFGMLGLLFTLVAGEIGPAQAATPAVSTANTLGMRLARLTDTFRSREDGVRFEAAHPPIVVGYAFLNNAPSFRNHVGGWINRVSGWPNAGTFLNSGARFLNNVPSFRNSYYGWPNRVHGWVNGGGFRNAGGFANGSGFRNGGGAFRNGGGFLNR